MHARDLGMFALGTATASAAAWLLGRQPNPRRTPILRGWPRVLVVGAGFGGLHVARQLAGVEADVLVVDRHNYHCFQPLLYQVATAGLEPEEIAHPVRQMLRDLPNVRFRLATVERVDLAQRRVIADVGPIAYDYLVLAAGSVTNYFGMADLADRSYALKGLNQAVALRNHLLECFEQAVVEPDAARRSALLTFVVAGGGPTGVEFAGALAELIRLALVRDYAGLDVRDAQVVLVEAGPAVLPAFAPGLQKAAIRDLRQKGVDVRVNAAVKRVDADAVTLADQTVIATHTLVWTAGVRAAKLGQDSGLPTERNGRLAVEPTLQLSGHPEVYVIGDLAHLEQDGQPLPMLAPVAIQQGQQVARNLQRQIAGLPPEPFVYHDKGTMATIGRNAAVAQIGRWQLTGFLAWVAWLFVHLLQIVSFRNRLLVLVNWIWDYLFYDRAVRLITND